MANVAELTAAIMEEAARRGIPMTQEQAAAEAARVSLQPPPAAESRMDGAPEVDLTDLTPQAYTDTLNRRGRQLEMGGPSNPLPGQPGWTEDSDILAYKPGMTEEEYSAARANQSNRERMLRGMGPDPGGYTAFNPQQPMWMGTADDQAQWSQFLRDNPDAQERYDPAGYDARRAAEEGEAVEAHASRLQRRYGTQGSEMAEEYRQSQAEGRAPDSSVFRSPMENQKVDDRQFLERAARGFVDDGDLAAISTPGNPLRIALRISGDMPVNPVTVMQAARKALQRQDSASGYSGAMANPNAAVGSGPDGEAETLGDRFERSTKDRKADLKARKQALRNQRMLAGNNPANNMANAYTLMGDPFNDGLTQNQRRALEYTLPGGRLAAQVDARNMEEAAGLAARGLQSVLLPSVMQGMQGGEAVDPIIGGSDGSWRTTPGGTEAMTRLKKTFNNKQQMADFLQRPPYNYSQGEAEAAADWAFSWF